MTTHRLLTFLLSLRMIMLICSAGAMVGALLMFLQGGVLLHEAWHTVLAEGDAVQKQVEAVDSFPIGFVFTLPKGYGEQPPPWMKVGGVGQLNATWPRWSSWC